MPEDVVDSMLVRMPEFVLGLSNRAMASVTIIEAKSRGQYGSLQSQYGSFLKSQSNKRANLTFVYKYSVH